MKTTALVFAVALASAMTAAACSGTDDPPAPPPPTAPPGSNDPHDLTPERLPDPLANLPKGKDQIATVCARGAHDAVTKALCSGPTITSITDLQTALGLSFKATDAKAGNGANGNPAFALLGHSTALDTRFVSAVNPVAFVFTAPPGQPARLPNFVVMGFARGEPIVEIAAEDSTRGIITFYLLRFQPACEADDSCTFGDKLTPAVEKNWKGYTLYDDEDLKNTIVDCRQCHQPGGPSSKKMLRMQELQDPWTHWFRSDRAGGLALEEDFHRMHGIDEDYAGIPAAILDKADGRALQDFVTGQGFGDQPNVFDSPTIEKEVQSTEAAQPDVNMPEGQSKTWQSIYDASQSGQFIPVPYHDVKVTDPDKLAFVSDAYKQVIAGTLPTAQLPDIRRVFLDSSLPEMTMRPTVSATGKETLVQMCSQCHNGNLDSSVSRAHFDATNLDAASIQNAISRMKLPATDLQHMPPALFRTIPDDQLAAAIADLSK